MNCPICRKPVAEGAPDYPFCGERCRLLDLGNWASERYAIPVAPAPPPGDEED
ncbi:MAG: DNA gyrase inhibitor YacG [Bryobacteraceae bacterium]